MNSHSARMTRLTHQQSSADAEAQYRQACRHYLDRLFRFPCSDRERRELAAEIAALHQRARP
jgi:hypothetical protein